MKPKFLLIAACCCCLFSACKPDFNINSDYKDITVVYGVLNYKDSIQYVKIYKGFQPENQGSVFIDAQKPDKIYYPVEDLNVSLLEYKKDKNKYNRTSREEIPMYPTHDFPREAGVFYYDKERIIYYTKEELKESVIVGVNDTITYSYELVIKNNKTGKIVKGMAPIVGNFEFPSIQSSLEKMYNNAGSISFKPALNGFGYELHVNFLYFEVDKQTHKITLGKVTKNIGVTHIDALEAPYIGQYSKSFTLTFYDDIKRELKPTDKVRYIGLPGNNGACIELEGWAAGESMMSFLMANKPIPSFVQISNLYTNLTASNASDPSDDLAFGFFSSRTTAPSRLFPVDPESEKRLVNLGLGFRPWIEYKP